jgi:hypothetical protein
MFRTILVRRGGRLLGAVTVTGILSAGILAAAPLAADASTASQANGIRVAQHRGAGHVKLSDANGIRGAHASARHVKLSDANGI